MLSFYSKSAMFVKLSCYIELLASLSKKKSTVFLSSNLKFDLSIKKTDKIFSSNVAF